MGIIYRFRLTHLFYLLCIVYRMSRPFTEVGGPVSITQIAEGSVRSQPFFVSFEELLEFLGSQYFFPFLLEYQMEEFPFSPVYSLIINSCKIIQFLLFLIEPRGCFFVFQCSHLLYIRIHRMKSIDGNTVVGIRVRPCMGHGRVINR